MFLWQEQFTIINHRIYVHGVSPMVITAITSINAACCEKVKLHLWRWFLFFFFWRFEICQAVPGEAFVYAVISCIFTHITFVVQMQQLPRSTMDEVISSNRFLMLPRLSSQSVFDELCPKEPKMKRRRWLFFWFFFGGGFCWVFCLFGWFCVLVCVWQFL